MMFLNSTLEISTWSGSWEKYWWPTNGLPVDSCKSKTARGIYRCSWFLHVCWHCIPQSLIVFLGGLLNNCCYKGGGCCFCWPPWVVLPPSSFKVFSWRSREETKWKRKSSVLHHPKAFQNNRLAELLGLKITKRKKCQIVISSSQAIWWFFRWTFGNLAVHTCVALRSFTIWLTIRSSALTVCDDYSIDRYW